MNKKISKVIFIVIVIILIIIGVAVVAGIYQENQNAQSHHIGRAFGCVDG